MPHYQSRLKSFARQLRTKQTREELILWHRLRRKQIHGIQFYRQRPLGKYIVDFYAPAAKLVIELDGLQHFTPEHQAYDKQRDWFLNQQGLHVLRFNNLEVTRALESVMQVIEHTIEGKKVVVEHGGVIEWW